MFPQYLQGDMINTLLCGGRGRNIFAANGVEQVSNVTNQDVLPIEMDPSQIPDNKTYRCKEVTSESVSLLVGYGDRPVNLRCKSLKWPMIKFDDQLDN